MTSQQDQTDGKAGEMTRRSAMKMGALGASGLVLGLAGTGSAAAQQSDQQNAQQDDDDLFVNEEQIDAAMYTGDFNASGNFIITSDVIEWTPNVNENIQGVFDQFNTHMIKYQNSNRQGQLFIAADAELPPFNSQLGYVVDDDENYGSNEQPQPEVYTVRQDAQFFDNANQSLINVTVSPLEENNEDDILDFTDRAGDGRTGGDDGWFDWW